MIDRGLLISMVFAAALTWAAAHLVRARGDGSASGDAMLSSAVIGLVVGRIVAVALDDPAGLLRLRDVMIVRSGVEFWPGLAGGAVAYLVLTRDAADGRLLRLAAAAPLFAVGYAGYEAACIVRDGCFGPPSAVGLTPPGFTDAVIPVGIAVAAVVTVLVVGIRRLGADRGRQMVLLILAIALARSVAGFHLPRLGTGLSRPHLESIAVAAIAMAVHLGWGALSRHTTSSRTVCDVPPSRGFTEPRKGS